jgi:Bacterial Ig domain
MKTIKLALALLSCSYAQAAVAIMSPTNGSTVTSPVALNATASGSTASLVTVYVDSSLVTQKQNTSSIKTSLTLANGTHTIQVSATYRTRGHSSVVSAIANITVGSGVANPPTSLAAQIAADMQGLNEGNPQGVPLTWDWAVGPVLGAGNIPPSGWTASTSWGVVYVASQGNPATNTRVNIRNQQLWILSKSKGIWALVQNTSQPDGGAYLEDFSGDSSIPGDVRYEPDGTISVTAGMGAWAGYNYHFYPAIRGSINPTDIAGVVSLVEARLILNNPSLPDDRGTAHYLLGAGADYWPSVSGSLPSSYNGVVPPVANGKMKYVETGWRSFAMTTMTQTDLVNNPPPIDLTGILP